MSLIITKHSRSKEQEFEHRFSALENELRKENKMPLITELKRLEPHLRTNWHLQTVLSHLVSDFCGPNCIDTTMPDNVGCCNNPRYWRTYLSASGQSALMNLQNVELKITGRNKQSGSDYDLNSCRLHSQEYGCSINLTRPMICTAYLCDSAYRKLSRMCGDGMAKAFKFFMIQAKNIRYPSDKSHFFAKKAVYIGDGMIGIMQKRKKLMEQLDNSGPESPLRKVIWQAASYSTRLAYVLTKV